VSTHLDQRLNASKAEVIPDRWIIGVGLYLYKSKPSLITVANFNHFLTGWGTCIPMSVLTLFEGCGQKPVRMQTSGSSYSSGRPPGKKIAILRYLGKVQVYDHKVIQSPND